MINLHDFEIFEILEMFEVLIIEIGFIIVEVKMHRINYELTDAMVLVNLIQAQFL
jgi:hypothetical protein